MAEGFLKNLDSALQVYSAGTNPASQVSPYAVKVMQERDIDISKQKPKNVEIFLEDHFDFVITVCDNAKETCPVFTGKVKEREHIGFEDPADAQGTNDEILNKYREVRDLIFHAFSKFYQERLSVNQ